MSAEMSKNVPIALLGIFTTIAIVLVVSIYIQEVGNDTDMPMQPPNSHVNMSGGENDSNYLSGEIYSGPFAIFNERYGVDDTVFFIGSEISQESKGNIFFVRPDGEIHHTLYFDGEKQAVNHYFTPVSSSDLKECPDCGFFGTWEITFNPIEGSFYSPIRFEVTDSR